MQNVWQFLSDTLDTLGFHNDLGKIYCYLFLTISVPFKLFRIFRGLYVQQDIEYYNVFLVIFQSVAFPALWPFRKNGLEINGMISKACIKK